MHNGEEEWKVKNSIHVNAAAVFFSPIKFDFSASISHF